MPFDRDKFTSRFIDEAKKHIRQLNAGLLALEQEPEPGQKLNTLFRSAHTVKGAANMMGYVRISELAHEIENRLSELRDGERELTSGHIDALLQDVDTLEAMITDIAEASGSTSSPEGKKTAEQVTISIDRRKHQRIIERNHVIKAEKLDELTRLVSELSLWSRTLQHDMSSISKAAQTTEALHRDFAAGAYEQAGRRLDELKSSSEQVTSTFSRHVHELSGLNEELKEMLFSLRMVPLSLALEKYSRVVRETASQLGKKIDLTVTGDDTELDKSSLELIDEAMLQIVKNAVDHGIETAEKRTSLGKPERGTISIDAGYQHGMCRITIADDGSGVDIPALCERAVGKSLLSDDEAKRIIGRREPRDVARLLFTPGLSAKEGITGLSGRGVGMDIVQENIINRLEGTLSAETRPDAGTTFTLVLPLTAVIMMVSVFRIGEVRIALPMHAITRILRYQEAECTTVVGRRALRYREQLIPVSDIRHRFTSPLEEVVGVNDTDRALLVIVRTGAGEAAFAADEITYQESFVIQALPEHLRGTSWVSGAVVTGIYETVPLLNPRSLLDGSSAVQSQQRDDAPREQSAAVRILVVDDSVSTRDIEKSILESYGYTVEIAGDGMEAEELSEERQFDLIITDIEMPRMDGITLTKRLRSQRAYRHIPVILVSSRDSEEDRKRGIEAGADAYIVKSAFDQEQLIRTIRTLTE